MTLQKSFSQSTLEEQVMKAVVLDNFSTLQENATDKTDTKSTVKLQPRKSIVIKKTTVSSTLKLQASDYPNFRKNVFNTLDSLTYIDFLEKRNSIREIEDLQISDKLIKIRFIDTIRLANIFETGGWGKFNKTYSLSTNLVQISRVGFNKDSTQALVYYSSSNCGLCGSGYICLYELIKSKWYLVEKYMEWIS